MTQKVLNCVLQLAHVQTSTTSTLLTSVHSEPQCDIAVLIIIFETRQENLSEDKTDIQLTTFLPAVHIVNDILNWVELVDPPFGTL